MPGLTRVAENGLRQLAAAFEAGRLGVPIDRGSLRSHVAPEELPAAFEGLEQLIAAGFNSKLLAMHLRALIAEREKLRAAIDGVELVWSGPTASPMRDTGVVVRELFATAQTSVWVVGFAVAEGKEIFEVLARRLEDSPALDVRLFLNVARRHDDDRDDPMIVSEFAAHFRAHHWPGVVPPTLYYDPRSLVLGKKRAVLHAKCIIVDDRRVFVTSANFTEAAQERNIEAGLLLVSAGISRRLRGQFERLVDAKVLVRLDF